MQQSRLEREEKKKKNNQQGLHLAWEETLHFRHRVF